MKLDNMFKKMKPAAAVRGGASAGKPEVPEGLLRRCNKCHGAIIANIISVRSAADIFMFRRIEEYQ